MTTPPPTPINWGDNNALIGRHFTVGQALYLPSWHVYHIPSEQEKANILLMAAKMDMAREFLLMAPVKIHCWIRPILNNPASPHHGQDYNKFIGGGSHSAHKAGSAVDWDCGEDCDLTRHKLLPMLEPWKIRMEKNPGSGWVHLDDFPVGPSGRYFIP